MFGRKKWVRRPKEVLFGPAGKGPRRGKERSCRAKAHLSKISETNVVGVVGGSRDPGVWEWRWAGLRDLAREARV